MSTWLQEGDVFSVYDSTTDTILLCRSQKPSQKPLFGVVTDEPLAAISGVYTKKWATDFLITIWSNRSPCKQFQQSNWINALNSILTRSSHAATHINSWCALAELLSEAIGRAQLWEQNNRGERSTAWSWTTLWGIWIRHNKKSLFDEWSTLILYNNVMTWRDSFRSGLTQLSAGLLREPPRVFEVCWIQRAVTL